MLDTAKKKIVVESHSARHSRVERARVGNGKHGVVVPNGNLCSAKTGYTRKLLAA